MSAPARKEAFAAVLLALMAMAASSATRSTNGNSPRPPPQALVQADGTVVVSGMVLPPSTFSSREAHEELVARARAPRAPPITADIAVLREFYGKYNDRLAERMKALYPVRIEPRRIGGVNTEVITPLSGPSERNANRVLINLHGGAFLWGEGSGGEVEAVPIAHLGGFKVVTVAYRQGPEHRFPAASEDVAAVYKALLSEHDARRIGIYGCSAGGMLTAQSIAWFDKVGLPMPGAIGTFCASASPLSGDSTHIATGLAGEVRADLQELSWPYFVGARADDPLVYPVRSPALLGRFPPTLLLAGSRDFAMSSLFNTQRELVKAGVKADLHVWDGLRHAFFIDPDLPESREAYDVMIAFFDRHLAR